MSICIARFRETVTPLMRSCLHCPVNRYVFKSCLKRTLRLDHMGLTNLAVSSKQSGRRLRNPGCQKCCDETVEYSVCDGWLNGDVGGRKLQRLARSSQRGRLIAYLFALIFRRSADVSEQNQKYIIRVDELHHLLHWVDNVHKFVNYQQTSGSSSDVPHQSLLEQCMAQ